MSEKIFNKKNKLEKTVRIIFGLMILAFLIFIAIKTIKSPNSITTITQSVGIFGPLVLVLLIIVGVLLTPIPAALIIIAAGYLYGPYQGAIYSYIGNVSAALIAFFIFKEHIIENNNKKRKKYVNFIRENINFLYAVYIIPVIPISIVSMASAASNIKWKRFIKIVLISFIPNVLFFTFLGHRFSKQNLKEIIGLTFVALIAVILILRYVRKKVNT